MSHIALFQFPWQQMSVQPSRNIHHLSWVTAPWDVRTLICWTRSTVEKEVYSEISLNFSFRNRREKWFTKSPGTKGGDPVLQISSKRQHHRPRCHFTFSPSGWNVKIIQSSCNKMIRTLFVAHKGISRCTVLTKCGWKCEKCTRNWGIFQIAPIYHQIIISLPNFALSQKRLRNFCDNS